MGPEAQERIIGPRARLLVRQRYVSTNLVIELNPTCQIRQLCGRSPCLLRRFNAASTRLLKFPLAGRQQAMQALRLAQELRVLNRAFLVYSKHASSRTSSNAVCPRNLRQV